ncbi:ribonuclease H-like domain-containing protein [Tanacetum coccineum]
MTHPHPKRNFVPAAVLTKSGQVPVNATKQSSHRAATSVSAARRVNTAAPSPNMNDALQTTYSYFKAHSAVTRPFNQKSAAKTNNVNEKVNTATVNNVTTAGPKAVVSDAKGNRDNAGNPQYALQDQGIFDSGCSRHMTGNKSYLTDYQEIDGGFVAFGGNAKGGKITGKGKIRTGKLDFEDVYFVKELKFNLFSVSQMCDKKNSVLFTDTECVVLSPDFKLPDESQVLLKVPRNNNMYSFDLKNVVPLGGLTCLFAKATLDESNLWHRRLGHINFKTMNKLVRGNLVRGTGLNWTFDIDSLTMFMNYQPVFAGNQTNGNACTKENIDAGQAKKKRVPGPQYIAGQKNGVLDPAKEGDKNGQEKDVRDQEEALRKQFEQEFERLSGQREATNTNNTNRLNTISSSINAVSSSFTTVDPGRERAQRNEFESVFGQDKDANGNSIYRMFTPVNAVRSSYDNLGGSIPVNAATLSNADLLTDHLMPDLEDIVDLQVTGIFNGAYDDKVKSVVTDFNNLELTTIVIPIPTTRIHKDHLKEQIIGDPLSEPQTRRMTKTSQEHAMVSYIKRQRRTNHKEYRKLLLCLFLSQIEPKKVTQALTYPNSIEAMQDELLQFRLQKVLETRQDWLHKLHPENRIDYDEVNAHVARIEAIRSTKKSLCDTVEESRKSPTKSLIDAGFKQISIFIVEYIVTLTPDVLANITMILRRTQDNTCELDDVQKQVLEMECVLMRFFIDLLALRTSISSFWFYYSSRLEQFATYVNINTLRVRCQ